MTTYYVSPTGSDSNSGLDALHPWQTLTQVKNSVAAGDTALFAPGTYTGGVQFNTSGTALAPITLKSQVSWKGGVAPVSRGAVIVEPGGAGIGTAVITLHGDYTVLDGFEVTGPNSQFGVFLYSSFSTAQNCWVHDVCNAFDPGSLGGYGIGNWFDSYHASGVTIQGNRVERAGPKSGGVMTVNSFVHNLYVQVDNYAGAGLIQNNLSIQSAGWGIAMFHNPNNWTVTNNTVINALLGGQNCWGDTGSGYLADHNTIQNNLYVDCGQPSWRVAIWSESDACGTHNVFRNNLAAFTGGTALYDFTPAATVSPQKATNLANAFPAFVSYAQDGTGDYHLAVGSNPAVDSGSASLAPLVDFDGQTRPQGGGVDVGAFERVTTSSKVSYTGFSVTHK